MIIPLKQREADTFRFRKFVVKQSNGVMRVGTDGLLLGAWTSAASARHILDIGTGTGLVALMLAQRTDACIDAVECSRGACTVANENFRKSSWHEKITLWHMTFQEFTQRFPDRKYDLIVSNPPFFTRSLRPDDHHRAAARHNSSLSFEDLSCGVSALLSQEGRFSLILPPEEGVRFNDQALKNGLHCSEITRVFTTEKREKEKRWLLKYTLRRETMKESEIALSDLRGNRTEEFHRLTQEYYTSS